MCRRWAVRLGVMLALIGTVLPVLAASGVKLETFQGKVVPLSEIVGKSGGKLDADAAPFWLALVTADSKVYPLVKDSGARMFFKDRALLGRPMQLTGRLIPGSTLLRVSVVNSLHRGKLHEVYYWCDICAIRRGEKNICECCGGPMELKEEPLER